MGSKPALVMLREDATGYEVTAANPENEAMSLRVRIGGREVILELPDGDAAGSSVSTHAERRESVPGEDKK
jgi:hypothetical protein